MTEEIISSFRNSNVCNSLIKSTFLKFLSQLDFNITVANGSIMVYSDSCHIEIRSIPSESIKLTFDFWKNQVNIYLGEEKIQYADDANVITESDQNEFEENLQALFYSRIMIESLKYKFKRSEYKISFIDDQEVVTKSFKTTSALLIDESIYPISYKPWLIKVY